MFSTANLTKKTDRNGKSLLFSGVLFFTYLSGILGLSQAQEMSWSFAPAFWVGIIRYPLWVKTLSGLTVLAGTLLIYFIPGIYIAKHFARVDEDRIETFLKGFLINYAFYFVSSTLYKAVLHQEFTRETMVLLMGFGILMAELFFLLVRKKGAPEQDGIGVSSSREIKFLFLYAVVLAGVFTLSHGKILFSHFGGDGDGAEQYWLAHSLKTQVLPTIYGADFTIVPQFVFAPSVFLNMFALTLFGDAEFTIRIGTIVAYIGLGFILKGLIEKTRGNQKLSAIEFIPLLLYLVLFFIIIAFRAAYISPTDLAKSNETLQLAFFLAGFYLLAGSRKDYLAATFFVLAAMIRYNGCFMITFFLIGFSVLFGRYKCLLLYMAGAVLSVLALNLMLIPSAFKFPDAVRDFWRDIEGLRVEKFDLQFLLAYLQRYFICTAFFLFRASRIVMCF